MSGIKMAALGIGAALAAAPASAAVYDLGDVGGQFSYAQYDGGSSFTAFAASCPSRPDLASCNEGPQGAGSAQVVYDGGSYLVAHPGTTAAANTAVLFTAPTSSLYRFDVTASLIDGNGPGTDGVSLLGYFSPFGTFNLGALTPPVGGPTSAVAFNQSFFLNGGDRIGLIFGNNGGNNNDSIGLSGTVAAVPEPATWAMMIGGFGLVGGAVRRRTRQAVRVTYA